MNIPVEVKRVEAVRRLKALDIFPDAVSQFEKSGAVMVSEPPLGALYYLDDEQKKLVGDFEKEYHALVYLVVRSYTEFGKMDSFLYVSDCEEEWDLDFSDVREGYPFTYTHNYDCSEFSEFGSIGVIKRGGGLIRSA